MASDRSDDPCAFVDGVTAMSDFSHVDMKKACEEAERIAMHKCDRMFRERDARWEYEFYFLFAKNLYQLAIPSGHPVA